MKPNQLIEIRLVNDRGQPVPIANIIVEVHFTTNGSFRYGFKVGRTDESGALVVAYADIEKVRRSNAEANVMDYNTRLEDCDPSVTITVPSDQKLREQYENAMRFYHSPPTWAKEWPSNARVKENEEFIQLIGPVTQVRIRV